MNNHIINQTLNQRLTNCIRPNVRKLAAYQAAPDTYPIKLDAMESPYAWPYDANLKQRWLQQLAEVAVNRYPDSSGQGIITKLKQRLTIPDTHKLLLGNGSDELIQIVLLACAFQTQCTLLSPEPSFSMYTLISQWLDGSYSGIPLQADNFQLDMGAISAAITQHNPAVIMLAIPNNPTGQLYPEAEIRQIIEMAPGLVMIDAAYGLFHEFSYTSMLAEYEHLLLLGTFSKVGLAGLRFGYLAAHQAVAQQLNKLRLPYNINSLTQASMNFALDHYDHLLVSADKIKTERVRLMALLQQLPLAEVFPSAANFILVRTQPKAADQVFEALKQQGILIKNLTHTHPLLTDCLRISIGTKGENDQFINALKAIL